MIGLAVLFIYACNEPKSVLARDLGDCRDNLRNSRSVFLIVMWIMNFKNQCFFFFLLALLVIKNTISARIAIGRSNERTVVIISE